MFGSTIIDVALGMAFVYLLVSLTITSVTELLAGVRRWRAKNLYEGIKRIVNLDDPAGTQQADLVDRLYNNPLIKALHRKGDLPSYIPSRTFALSLLKELSKTGSNASLAKGEVEDFIQGLPDSKLKETLTILAGEAGNDAEKFKEQIEIWFNNSMDRVSGWYKRKTQFVHVILSAIICLGLNVDSIDIARSLSIDPTLRARLVQIAEQSSQQQGEAQPAANTQQVFSSLKDYKQQLESLGVPVGWSAATWPQSGGFWVWVLFGLTKMMGLALTTAAGSLGAPFWFDVLNKIIVIRSAGKAPEEKPKSPKEEPQPLGPGQTPEERRFSEQTMAALLAGVAALSNWAAASQSLTLPDLDRQKAGKGTPAGGVVIGGIPAPGGEKPETEK